MNVSQAQLACNQPSTSKSSGDRFRIPFKKGRGSRGKQAKKGKKGGGSNQTSSSSKGGGGGQGAGRGHGRGRGGGTKKDLQNQAPKLTQNEQLCPMGGGGGGGGGLKSFAHMCPLVTSDQFVLQTVTKAYRIEFTGNPPRTTEARCTPIPRNQTKRRNLEQGLESMLDNRAIREIPRATDVPGFYSPIFLVAKESGGWRPILNLKAFNKFAKPPPFWMETLRTVMDCLGEAHQQRLKTSDYLRDSSMSETWAVSKDLRDAQPAKTKAICPVFVSWSPWR